MKLNKDLHLVFTDLLKLGIDKQIFYITANQEDFLRNGIVFRLQKANKPTKRLGYINLNKFPERFEKDPPQKFDF